jgi:LysM repeat protein
LRKWTKSACVVVAWGIILPVLMGLGSTGSGRPAQANTSIAISAQVTATRTPVSSKAVTATAETALRTTVAAVATWVVQPGDTLSAIAAALAVPGGWQALYAANRSRIGPDPNVIQPGTVLVVPGQEEPDHYTVAPGDTLSGIAAALGVRGGWRTLYAANRRLIGPDPDLIRPGTVLTAPHPAVRLAPGHQAVRKSKQHPATAQRHPRHRLPTRTSARSPKPSAHLTIMSGGMPPWLEDVLLAVGLLAALALLADPLLTMGRRYQARRAARHALPWERPSGDVRTQARLAAERARIILADHERLIVTYSVRDDTVYVLTPPGEDPQAVLRAARLVLPDEKYEELAAHLGVQSDWPSE